MSRRGLVRVATAGALLAVALAAGPTKAQDTDISGRVESVIELSLTRAGADRVQATVSATVPGTGVTVSEVGRPTRTLRAYRGPITNARVIVSAVEGTDVTEQTITFGAQTP